MKKHDRKWVIAAALLFFIAAGTYAQESFTLETGLFLTGQTAYKLLDNQPDPKNAYEHLQIGMLYGSPSFDAVIRGSMIGNALYDGGDEQAFLGSIMASRYLIMDEGYTDFRFGNFSVRTGYTSQTDEIDSPYSLFISSNPHSLLMADVRFDNDIFFFHNRWSSLNARSRNYYTGFSPDEVTLEESVLWVDRGMVSRSYGADFGALRVGFQDSTVFLNREFAPEYFFNPIPMYLIQIITDNPGRPWGEYANTSSFFGGFVEYESGGDYYTAQLLLDDVNFSFLPGLDPAGNFFKMAWSFGGSRETPWGTFGFYHAGATKYTFAATYSDDSSRTGKGDETDVYYNYLPYEYTYYPVSTYKLDTDDQIMPLHYQDNYIGYKYGENNIAFLVDWQNRFFEGDRRQFDIYSNLEWVLNGAKAPNNPWHEGHDTSVSDAYLVLLDGTVEHIVRTTTRLAKPVGNFTFTLDLTLGYIFNAMKLDQSVANEAYIFYPQPGVREPLLIATIGGVWSLGHASSK